jgi:hypothetical protein
MAPALYALVILEIRSHELFGWAGLEPDLTFQIARITEVSH